MLILLALLGCGQAPPPPPPVAAPPPAPPPLSAPPVEMASNNRPPRIARLALSPKDPKANNDIQLDLQVDDPDNNRLDVQKTWFLNGQALTAEQGRFLSSKMVKKGDIVKVAVTATDGEATVTGESEPVRVQNSPPTITNRLTDLSRIDGFRVTAEDLDKDPITFKLDGAPPALRIDARSGELHYAGTPDDEGGQYDVTISADDGDGGYSKWTFKMSVEPGSAAKAKAEKAKAEAERR